MNTVSFKIQGEFITNLAREKCFYEGNFQYAIELLSSCMGCDELSKNEIYNMAVAILDGRAVLKGTYPSDDYGFEYLEEKDSKWDFGKLINSNFEKIEKSKNEYNNLLQKYLFIIENTDEWKKKNLNRDYKKEYGELLFNDLAEPPTTSLGNSLLDSFIKRQMSNTEDDYGWLEPNGTFHAVEWGEHQDFADDWMKKNLSEEEYGSTDKILSKAGDYLAEKGWVLLHNPSQGIAFPTRAIEHEYTKKQKDFLFDYYMKRDCEKEANAFFED